MLFRSIVGLRYPLVELPATLVKFPVDSKPES